LNSEAFDGLTKLSFVKLKDNICIQEDFQDLKEVANISKALIDKCRFMEPKTQDIIVKVIIAVVCSLSGIVFALLLYCKFCCKRKSTVAKPRGSVEMVPPKV
jgi:hypothetical protein